MKQFKFKLGRLLDYRNSILHEAEGRYGAAMGAVAEVDRRIADFTTDREHHKDLLRSINVGELERNEAIVTRQFIDRSWMAILRARAERQQVEAVADEIREEMVAARREVRVLELLREKRHAAWKKSVSREEDLELDEMGTRLWWARPRGYARAEHKG